MVIMGRRLSPDEPRRINHFRAGRSFGEGQAAARRHGPAAGRRSGSSAEHHIDPAHHLGEVLGWQLGHALGEKGAIDGDDLRRIGHRILREARGVRGEEHVPGRPGSGQIARQRHTDHRGNPASIQVIALHDHHGSSATERGARGAGRSAYQISLCDTSTTRCAPGLAARRL